MTQQPKIDVEQLPDRHLYHLPIGEVMVNNGVFSRESVSEILVHQKEKDILFGEAALTLGVAKEVDVQRALASQFACMYPDPRKYQMSERLVIAHQPFSHDAARFRELSMQLLMAGVGAERKMLTVVSATGAEAATYFSANLAASISQLNKRVLLIDGNLQSPCLGPIFQLERRPGFSDLIVGRVGTDAITPISGFFNLFVLVAGNPLPNPQEVFCRSTFSTFNELISGMFDVVVYETNFLSTISSILAISNITKNVLLVSRKHESKINELACLTNHLDRLKIPLVGSVLLDF